MPSFPQGFPSDLNKYEDGHIAMTYTALCCLLILGDDLSRVNKKAVIDGLKSVQLKNGRYGNVINDLKCLDT